MRVIRLIKSFSLLGLLAANLAQAQLRVEISGVGSTQLPIAVATFADEGIAPQQVSAIIRDDLARSGYFKLIEVGAVISETSSVNFGDWKSRGAEVLVVGSVQKLSDGRFDVRYKLLDTIKSSTLSGFSLAALPANTRLVPP